MYALNGNSYLHNIWVCMSTSTDLKEIIEITDCVEYTRYSAVFATVLSSHMTSRGMYYVKEVLLPCQLLHDNSSIQFHSLFLKFPMCDRIE